jgi:hypothetical protein
MPGEKISRQEDYIKMNEHEISSKKKEEEKIGQIKNTKT